MVRKKMRRARVTSLALSLAIAHAAFGTRAWAQIVTAGGRSPAGRAAGPSAAAAGIGSDHLASVPNGVFSAPTPAFAAPAANADVGLKLPQAAAAMIAAEHAIASDESAAPIADAAASVPRGNVPALDESAASIPNSTPDDARRVAALDGLLRRRFAALKTLFSDRGDDAAPAPVDPGAREGSGTKRMMGLYVASSISVQGGYEMLATASMPVYLDQTFHQISMMADLAIVGSLASIVGRQLSPVIVSSTPLRKSYVGLLSASGVLALTIGVFANLHALAIPALFGLMISFRMTTAAASTAERTVIPSVYGKDQVAMESLLGKKQSWAEVASVLVQNGSAVLIAVLGTATSNLLIAPLFILGAAVLLRFSLKIPKTADDARLAAWREKNVSVGGGVLNRTAGVFHNFGRQLALGGKIVMRDPALRASTMLTASITLFNILTYSLLVPTFGKFAIGPSADSSLAAPIMGLIAGLFSFGGLFAGKIVAATAAAVQARHIGDEAGAAEAARSSTIRWLKCGALSFLAVGAMALPLPFVGPLIHLSSQSVAFVLGAGTILSMWKPKVGLSLAMTPVLLAFPLHVSLVAAAFFAFGLLQVVASLKNDSLFNRLAMERAPGDYASAAAFVSALASFAGMLGLMILKFLIYGSLPFRIPTPLPAFGGLPGIWPFVAVFGGLAVPAMIAMLHFSSTLNRLTRPRAAAPDSAHSKFE